MPSWTGPLAPPARPSLCVANTLSIQAHLWRPSWTTVCLWVFPMCRTFGMVSKSPSQVSSTAEVKPATRSGWIWTSMLECSYRRRITEYIHIIIILVAVVFNVRLIMVKCNEMRRQGGRGFWSGLLVGYSFVLINSTWEITWEIARVTAPMGESSWKCGQSWSRILCVRLSAHNLHYWKPFRIFGNWFIAESLRVSF